LLAVFVVLHKTGKTVERSVEPNDIVIGDFVVQEAISWTAKLRH
jgi:hypothetical protein